MSELIPQSAEREPTIQERFISFVDEHKTARQHFINGGEEDLMPIKSFDTDTVLDNDGEAPYLYTLGLHTVVNGASKELFKVYFDTYRSDKFLYGFGDGELESEPLSHSDVASLLDKLNALKQSGLVQPQQ
jgi:hypothetical protein